MATAREAAFRLLFKMEKQGAYSNLLLENSALLNALDGKERALATALVYGVTERLLSLDYELSLYLKTPVAKTNPAALCILRLGLYQILFMQKIPVSAAVNESVKLAKRHCSFAAPMINAVLRKTATAGFVLPPEYSEQYLSVKYACPSWLIEQWTREYGEENAKGILASSLEPHGVCVRVNTMKTDLESLKSALEREGVICENGTVPDSLLLSSLPCAVDRLEAFQKGWFHVQDAASQLCAAALNTKNGMRVFDLCSAPGGKAFTCAELMQNEGEILAFDLYRARVGLIQSGAERLGLSIVRAMEGDASSFNPTLGKADRVLCDVPCSGLGILRQKPEVKYKDPESLRKLPALQLSILENGARYLNDMGRLVYSTCALSCTENEDVCERFLALHPDFCAVSPLPQMQIEPFVTLFPHIHHCDGFFIAAFEKRGAR